MTLPDDIVEILRSLGEAPARYASIAESQGVEFLRFFIAKLVSSARLFDEWFPRLTAFAAVKRAENPVPPAATLSPVDRAWIRILEPKIMGAEHVPSRGLHTAVIFTAPLCALQVVQSHWPGEIKNGVFLTPSESKEWHAHYVHPDGEFWWFVYQWWDIEDRIEGKSGWFWNGPPMLPSEMTPWLVHCGLQWGSLAGGEKAELWGWNGRQEELIELLGVCDY
jgi:hypothetical protein